MYDLIKNFIIGGTIISLTTYFIQKDANNITPISISNIYFYIVKNI